jgi:hypothetical protein
VSAQQWKNLERRVCRLFGGERSGPLGRHVSDCVDTPFAIEVKRSKVGSIRTAWIEKARSQGKLEGLPWLLVVAGHNDRRPVAICDLGALVDLAYKSGVIGAAEDVE